MTLLKIEVLPVRNSGDIVIVRQAVRSWATEVGFNLVDQTKMVTATSEIARNTVDYGGGGTATLELLNQNSRRGLRVTFEDKGPGIGDVQLAMCDGYTTSQGLGLGLGGAKRLVNDFSISSRPGEGTRVVITKWKS
jgi:serine/threonine-protein kinase RsbT